MHDEREGGGQIISEVCHFVDLCQCFTGSYPVSVYAQRLSGSGGLGSTQWRVVDQSGGLTAEGNGSGGERSGSGVDRSGESLAGRTLAGDDVAITITFIDGSVATIVYTADGDKAYSRERFEVQRSCRK